MLKQETQVIDDLQFTVTQFAAMRAFSLLARLVKTIGPAISVLQGADGEMEIAALAPLIAAALKDIDPDAATKLAADVLAGTVAVLKGQNVELSSDVNINLVFQGRLMTMFKVLALAVRVNYADFFSAGAELAARNELALA